MAFMSEGVLHRLSSTRVPVILTLLFVGLVRFVNLGVGEIQEWDESLYAVRAKSIVYFGDWLDQTEHAAGGLYSAAHPPLYIWLTAIGYKLFGITNFTTRLWSAVFACGLVLVVFALGKRLFDRETGFIAAILLGTAPLFTNYSRLGQLDIAYLFFLAASVFFFITFLEGGTLKNLILAGVAFGFTLASKSLAGVLGLPIVFLCAVTLSAPRAGRHWRTSLALVFYGLIGMALVLPWYLYMEMRHGHELQQGFFISHVLGSFQSVAEGLGTNVKELGFFYFLNQLMVRFPLTGLAFVYVPLALYQVTRGMSKTGFNARGWFVLSWFLLVFLFFSVLRTKIVSYVLPMLIPLSLLTAHALVQLQTGKLDRRSSILCLLGAGFGFIWSASDEARVGIKGAAKSILSGESASLLSAPFMQLLVAGVLLLGLLILLWRVEGARALVLKHLPAFLVLVSSIFLLKQVVFLNDEDHVDGAATVASRLVSAGYDEILYLHTPHYTGGLNPQLAFYLDGVNCGWKKDKRFIEMSRSNLELISALIWKPPGENRLFIIIEKNHTDRPQKSPELTKLEGIVGRYYPKLLETRRYILYGKA